jgi:hypothetical protein
MSVALEVVAWVCIGLGTVCFLHTLIEISTRRAARKQKHGRVLTMGEAWSDIRTYLPGIAVGVSLLSYRWKDHSAWWWLANIPLFVIVAVSLTGSARSWIRRRPEVPETKPS